MYGINAGLLTLCYSPIQAIEFEGFKLHIKRDDLLDGEFSGNKARKFYALLQQDFGTIERIISYGSAQANSLYSLAVLAKRKGVKLDYYVDHIASFLHQKPAGNYARALSLDAHIIPLQLKQQQIDSSLEQQVLRQILPISHNYLYVPEGGRMISARIGVFRLADEIIHWWQQQSLNRLQVMLPAGTGTTALLLQQRFNQCRVPIEVLTCACVGSAAYLTRQFEQLCLDSRDHPTILSLAKKYHFGRLYPEFYQLWQQLKQQVGITFELLYDPPGWLHLLHYLRQTANTAPILYIHQGGTTGNETMINRYERYFRRAGR